MVAFRRLVSEILSTAMNCKAIEMATPGSRDTIVIPCPDKRNYQTPAAQILQDMGMGYYLEVVTGEVESSENEG